jgi:hypothetical protein
MDRHSAKKRQHDLEQRMAHMDRLTQARMRQEQRNRTVGDTVKAGSIQSQLDRDNRNSDEPTR